MPFALLDEKFHSNGKVLRAGLDGAGLFACALSYASDHQTDGFIPIEWAKMMASNAIQNKLTKTALWVVVTEGSAYEFTLKDGTSYTVACPGAGYLIPDYLEYNPTKEKVLELREKRAKAGAQGARKRWQKPPGLNGKPDSKPIALAIAPATEIAS